MSLASPKGAVVFLISKDGILLLQFLASVGKVLPAAKELFVKQHLPESRMGVE
jgi:hypothetical protein